MAHMNPADPFDSHAESSGYANDDFEKLDAPGTGSGFDHDSGDAAGPNAGLYGGYDSSQDAEVSTTTDNAGEEEAEEDRYAVGASEAEAYAHSSEPLISLGDEYEGDEVIEDDPYQVQPSAPVPENIEPLIDFANSTEPDILPSIAPTAPPSSSHYPEPIPTTSNPLRHFQDISETESRPKQVEQSSQETEEKGSWLKGVDPRESKEEEADTSGPSPSCFKDLIYWRDVKKTGIVFGTMLVVLLSLAIFSLLSVVAYLSLAVLTVTFSFVVYKKIMGAVQKSNEGHPFKQVLEQDIALSEDKLKSAIQNIIKHMNCTSRELRRLFLVEDIVDSIKFGLLLWALTYIGSWFNGMTLIIIGLVLIFTLPKVYETYKVQIDNYVGLAKAQINNVLNIIQSKLPFLKKKEKAQ